MIDKKKLDTAIVYLPSGCVYYFYFLSPKLLIAAKSASY